MTNRQHKVASRETEPIVTQGEVAQRFRLQGKLLSGDREQALQTQGTVYKADFFESPELFRRVSELTGNAKSLKWIDVVDGVPAEELPEDIILVIPDNAYFAGEGGSYLDVAYRDRPLPIKAAIGRQEFASHGSILVREDLPEGLIAVCEVNIDELRTGDRLTIEVAGSDVTLDVLRSMPSAT